MSQLMAVDRDVVVGKLGHLAAGRLAEVWSGIRLLLEPPAEVTAPGGPAS